MADEKADNNYDGTIGWALMAVIAAVIIWLIWYFNSEAISNVVRWIRYGEMWLISLFVSDDYMVNFNGTPTAWKTGFEDTPTFSSGEITPGHLSYFTALTMQPLKPVFAALLVLGGLWAMFFGPNTQYRTRLDLEGLIKRQAKSFPIIAPFVQFNPSKQPPRPPGSDVPAELPSFAEALGPEEWIAYNSIPIPDGEMDEKAAHKAFLKQLGRRWKGAKNLKDHEKILLAAFCLKASRQRNEAYNLLGRLSLCWTHEKGLNLKKDRKLIGEANKILRTKDLAQKTLSEANRHAFTTTALLRALQFAREEGGVLAPSTFVWLRAHDRTLWYPLNNMGRQSFHMEAVGAMAHFKAERMTKRPIPVPKVNGAIETIKEYMESEKARPVPALDYSNSKKRGVKKAV